MKNKDLLSVSLWLFLSLSLDIVVYITTSMLLPEGAVYRASVSKLITIVIWGISIFIAVRYLRNKKVSSLFIKEIDIRTFVIFLVIFILVSVINYNIKGLSTVQIIHEYQINMKNYDGSGILIFFLQMVYYLCEASLILLIVITSNRWGKVKYSNVMIPYGGIVLAITWGAIHFLTKGFIVGVYGVFISLLVGIGYVLTKENTILTYIVALAIFMI